MWVEGSKRQEVEAARLETETVLFLSCFVVRNSHRTYPLSRGEDTLLDDRHIKEFVTIFWAGLP